MARWVDEGEARVADILLGTQAVDDTLYLGLYRNASEPDEDATLSYMQEVPVGDGYARKSLTRGSWVTVGGQGTYAQQIFISSGLWGDVTGYFIGTSVDDTGILLSVEHFLAPFTIIPGGGVRITPKITVS
jgi:hypothetical protein